jgi:hypothetical protein
VGARALRVNPDSYYHAAAEPSDAGSVKLHIRSVCSLCSHPKQAEKPNTRLEPDLSRRKSWRSVGEIWSIFEKRTWTFRALNPIDRPTSSRMAVVGNRDWKNTIHWGFSEEAGCGSPPIGGAYLCEQSMKHGGLVGRGECARPLLLRGWWEWRRRRRWAVAEFLVPHLPGILGAWRAAGSQFRLGVGHTI